MKPVRVDSGIPFRWFWPVLAGALIGLFWRFVFSGKHDTIFSPMSGAFVFLTPLAIGVITVYVAERQERRSWSYYVTASIVANLLAVVGAIAALIEGIICAIIIAPMFAAIGAVGGLIMGALCRVTRWPRHAAFGFLALPGLVGLALPEDRVADRFRCVERTLVIGAPAPAIWREIGHATSIEPGEVDRAWIYRIGVPLPVSGVIESTPSGRVRKVRMGKDVHFDQVVTHWQENEYVRFTYRFDDDSFPPRALDDHVRIGGPYFDLLETSYTLTEPAPGTTLTRLQMCYRVTTDFNWYADLVARILIGNVEEVLLDFYRARAVATSG